MTAPEFLRAFFGQPGHDGGNEILLDHVRHPDHAPAAKQGMYRHLNGWAHALVGDPDLPIVLPRKVGGRLWWYALARRELDLHTLHDDLRAFVGPSYGQLPEARATLDVADPIEAAVDRFSGGRAFRFQGDVTGVVDALLLRARVREVTPERPRNAPRALGLLRRAFETALAVGDEGQARAALQHLREEGRLDALNHAFLEVHILATFGHWDRVLEVAHRAHLLGVRRPPRITEALARALVHTEIPSLLAQEDVNAAADAFSGTADAFAGLFRTAAGLRHPEALAAFALAALHPDRPDEARAREVVSHLPEGMEAPPLLGALGRALSSRSATPRGVADLEEARVALAEDHLDLAWTIARALSPDRERAGLLLRLAHERMTVEDAVVAREAFEALDQDDQDDLLRRPRMAERLAHARARTEAAGSLTVTSWPEWLEALHTLAPTDLPALAALAIEQRGAWTLTGLDDPATRTRFIEHLSVPEGRSADFLESLDALVAALMQEDRFPHLPFLDLYQHLLLELATSNASGRLQLQLYTRLLEDVLTLPFTPEEYRVLVQGGVVLWQRLRAAASTDLLLALLETLVVAPCHDTAERDAFVQTAFADLSSFASAHRLGPLQRSFGIRLLTEIGQTHLATALTTPVPTTDGVLPPEPSPLALLDGLTLGIYTLEVPAAVRAQALIEEACPHATVLLNHDHTHTDALDHLGRTADVCVVVTRAAKHAATESLMRLVPENRRVYATGKGTSSILRALGAFSKTLP